MQSKASASIGTMLVLWGSELWGGGRACEHRCEGLQNSAIERLMNDTIEDQEGSRSRSDGILTGAVADLDDVHAPISPPLHAGFACGVDVSAAAAERCADCCDIRQREDNAQ